MTRKYEKPLTAKELAARSDADIDFSDIPELDEAFLSKAAVTPPRTKPNVNLRLDEEVVAFYKGDNPKGYTSRMAAILTAYARSQGSKPSV